MVRPYKGQKGTYLSNRTSVFDLHVSCWFMGVQKTGSGFSEYMGPLRADCFQATAQEASCVLLGKEMVVHSETRSARAIDVYNSTSGSQPKVSWMQTMVDGTICHHTQLFLDEHG